MIITSCKTYHLVCDYFDGKISDKQFSKQIWKAVDAEKERRAIYESRLMKMPARDPQTKYQ